MTERFKQLLPGLLSRREKASTVATAEVSLTLRRSDEQRAEREADKEGMEKALRDLVSFRTIANTPEYVSETRKAFDYVRSCVQRAEVQSGRTFLMKEFDDGSGVPSILITPEDPSRSREDALLRPKVALMAHMDVVDVGGDGNLFALQRKGDTVIGRGANDDKGPIAVALKSWKDLTEMPVGFVIAITPDEEVGGYHGAKYLRDIVGFKPGFLFIPDASTEKVVLVAKGIWDTVLTYTSLLQKGGHGSRPQDYSAVDLAGDFRNLILKHRRYRWKNQDSPSDCTVNFGKMETPDGSVNKVAEHAMLTMDWRFPTEKQKQRILRDVKSALVRSVKSQLPLAYKGEKVPRVTLTESYNDGKMQLVVQVVPQGKDSYTVATLETLVDGPIYKTDRNHPKFKRLVELFEEETGKKVEFNEIAPSTQDGRWFPNIPSFVCKLRGSKESHGKMEQTSLEGMVEMQHVLEGFMREESQDNLVREE